MHENRVLFLKILPRETVHQGVQPFPPCSVMQTQPDSGSSVGRDTKKQESRESVRRREVGAKCLADLVVHECVLVVVVYLLGREIRLVDGFHLSDS